MCAKIIYLCFVFVSIIGLSTAEAPIQNNQVYGAPAPNAADNNPYWNLQLVRMKQLEQQRLLNKQYELQQQKDQYQMQREQQLKELEADLLKRQAAIQEQAQAQPAQQYGQPEQLVSAQSSSQYGAPQQELQVQAAPPVAEYGPPQHAASPPVVEYGAPPLVDDNVECDERMMVGRTRMLSVKTTDDHICNVKAMVFDRCPTTPPFMVVSEDADFPGACHKVTKVLQIAEVVGNTVSRVPGQVLAAAQWTVDAYDTVKDFYREKYYAFKNREHEVEIPQHSLYH